LADEKFRQPQSETTGTLTCHARESGHPARPRRDLDSHLRGNDTPIGFEAFEDSYLIVD